MMLCKLLRPTVVTSVCCGYYRDLKMENILLDKRKRNVKIVGKVMCHVKKFIEVYDNSQIS